VLWASKKNDKYTALVIFIKLFFHLTFNPLTPELNTSLHLRIPFSVVLINYMLK
jgi:hypothetical protein